MPRDRSRSRDRDRDRGRRDSGRDNKRRRSPSPKPAAPTTERKRRSKWDDAPESAAVPIVKAGGVGAYTVGNAPDMKDHTERRIVLSNITGTVTGQELTDFFNGAILAVCGQQIASTPSGMTPVYSCLTPYNGDPSKACLEFRTGWGACVGLKLQGIQYGGSSLTVTRVPEYVVPPTGDPSVSLVVTELSLESLIGVHKSGENKLSIFNLPQCPEDVARELLSQFGRLKMCNLIKDMATGVLKGYGFFEYDEKEDAELAVQALNGFVVGNQALKVEKLNTAKKASTVEAPKQQVVVASATMLSNSMTQKIVSNPVLAMQVKHGREVGGQATPVVQLLNAVYQEDLMDDTDYVEILQEINDEAKKYGVICSVHIPKPAKDGTFIEGVGKIFVEFQDVISARKFQAECNGRKFDGRVCCAAFYPLDRFQAGRYVLHG